MIVGMDFGTTNSGLSVYDGERLRLIPLDPANNNPAVALTAMYITNDLQIHIGRSAIDTYYLQNISRPVRLERVWVGEVEMTFAELPSFIKDIYIDKDVLEPGRLFLSFKTALSSENYLGTVVGSHFYFLEDIVGLYLYITRQRAESYLQQDIDTVVLGRPVRFAGDDYSNQLAQERLLKAAFNAGYKRVYLQFEPIAAAYHYASTNTRDQNILIFDFGGGTLDLSVIRLGSTTQQVLSIGGVPIAGDVFDQKLARANLPRHFGEGTTYRAGRGQLPVPSSYYEAFSSWQDLLLLQKPDQLEALERIAQTARRPLQIHALQKLISTNYGLRMYDIVEQAKRELSASLRTVVKLDIDGYPVRETVTRQQFESIIRSDIRLIAAEIDRVLADAGLKPDQIDAVIRTGGSSQIPAFIDLLAQQFGPDKVQNIDLFSSVTSGLGIAAHRIEQGHDLLQQYSVADWSRPAPKLQTQVSTIDLDMMKKFVDVQAADHAVASDAFFVALSDNHKVQVHPDDTLSSALPQQAIPVTGNDDVLMMTNDYLFVVKSTRQLMELNQLSVDISEAEGFNSDEFEQEHVCTLMNWSHLRHADSYVLVTSAGYLKSFKADTLRNRLEQPVAYRIGRQRGIPVALLGLFDEQHVFIAVSTSGRFVSIPLAKLGWYEGRILRTTSTDTLQATCSISRDSQLVALSSNGQKIVRIDVDQIPLSEPGQDTNGFRLIPDFRIRACVPATRNLQLVTTTQVLTLDIDSLPSKPSTLPQPNRGEKALTLIHHPV